MRPIIITPAMMDEARAAEATIIASLPKNSNYTGLTENNRYYYGTLGELAFRQLLDDENKQYLYQPRHARENSTSMAEDFVIQIAGYPDTTLDVKTCSQPHYVNMLIPDTQIKKYNYAIYVGVRLNRDVAEIHGFTLRQELEPITDPMPLVPSKGKALRDLRPISSLLDVML